MHSSHICLVLVWFVFPEDQPVFTRQDSGRNEKENAQVTHESEPDSGSQPRPAVSSGYSKQFQKSLPPRFQRQQVTNKFTKMMSFCLILNKDVTVGILFKSLRCWLPASVISIVLAEFPLQ